MNKAASLLGIAAGACLLAGMSACGTGQHAKPVAEKTAKVADPQGAQAITADRAVFDTGGHAAVIDAADVVQLSSNAGQSWTRLRLPATPATGHSIAVTGNLIGALTMDSHGMAYQRSGDGGQSWQRTAVPLSIPTDQADLAMSADGSKVAVLASVQGSANNGNTPELYVRDATGALVARQAPASGSIAWSGNRLLLAGGPLSSRLYASDDNGASWTARAVGAAVAPRFNLDPSTPSIGAPLAGPNGSVLVPVTSHSGNASSVQFFSSSNGAAFTAGVRVPLSGNVGSGTVAVVSAAGPAGYIVAEPGSNKLHLVQGTTQTTLSPTGLPGPVDSLSFADAQHGVAQVSLRSCSGGKQNCTQTVEVLATSDGGHTWSQATD
ncbi:MAG: hypothetical protein M3Y42_05820 [Actinomycetota bacterium]|nr:hypothetical protein [Actinomycetota bacterium]MDQ2956462.1 hypothetical protein [Actinomycetota bacterium]